MKASIFYLTLIALALQTQIAEAQDEYQPMDIYQIQLGAFKTEPDLKKFKDLEDLGNLSLESIESIEHLPEEDNLYRVYLGKYLGLETAEKVMEIVRSRGYDAVYDVDQYNLNHSTGKYLNYTLQLGASKKGINIKAYKGFGEYVLFQKNYFRVSLGLYQKSDLKIMRKELVPQLRKKKLRSFFRKFR